MRTKALILIALAILTSCSKKEDLQGFNEFVKSQQCLWNKNLTTVIMKDIFTPPVASRIYVYSNIASYEALLPGYSDFKTLAGQIKGLEETPKPAAGKQYYFPISSSIAFAHVAKNLVFAVDSIERYEKQYLESIKKYNLNEEIVKNSIEYGHTVGDHIMKWVSKDNYKQSRGFPRYSLSNDPGRWKPTPPDYMQAVEPHWPKIRPLVMDSCSQFQPVRPTKFDSTANSQFYKEAMEVYNSVKSLDPEKTEIAKFWDCNPNVSYYKGHVMYFHQKISPGGHWMSIAAIACQNRKLEPMQSAEAFALVSVTLFDGFISCWDEKYRSAVIRPETYIEKYIDPSWDPILQTPPFPEYTSGHSVVSGAASTMLTKLFGDNFEYVDSTEVQFGIPVRKFKSFNQAASEASISRLYGGIHYRPAIENGQKQGKALAQFILDRIKTRAEQQAFRSY